MKQFLFLAAMIAVCGNTNAQSWMHAEKGPVKYTDALARFPQQAEEDEHDEHILEGRKESSNHLFERWKWYWSQHLDKDGYMVPPVVGLQEWIKYMDAHPHGAAKTTATPSDWQFQGPFLSGGGYSGIGRINTVAFDPVDSSTIYIGSAAGSTWKTTDGGNTWTSLYDHLPTLGVADIKVNPQNRNTIYVATGDGDGGDAYSSGVIISHNGGTTWSTSGLSWLPTTYTSARSLLINPIDTTSMILASSNGLYKTHNAGATWTNVAPGNFKQILFKPGDTSIVYGTIYTDSSAQVVRSTNGGLTWTAVTNFNDAQRINLAICPASPTLVKAIASNNSSGLKGIYSSANSGATFTAVFTDDTSCNNNLLSWDLGLPSTGCGGQGWYDLCIAINPTNPLEVTIGGVNTYYSADGGANWQIANTWWGGVAGVYTVHADKHCLAYSPLTGALFETCDGGVYKNYGPITEPWTDLSSGIFITEFYRNAVDNRTTYAIGGAQDNGTKMVDGGVGTDLTGGDGMQPLVNYGDPANMWYCSFQNGGVVMTRDAGGHYHSITDTLHSSGAWVTPYIIHPFDTATLLLGYKRVFITHNNGYFWTPLSPIFDSNAYLDRVVMSTANTNYIYTVNFDYSVWKPVIHFTTNFGSSWDTLSIPFTDYISDLIIDPKDENHIWVTLSGYDPGKKVYNYNMTTHSWGNESGTLPNLPVNCMVVDTSTLTRYIGTDAAVFYKDTTMSNWVLFNNNMPSVHVSDLHINYGSGDLWAATFGRGMWKTGKADHSTIFVKPVVVPSDIAISPNPTHGAFTISTNSETLKSGTVQVRLIGTDGRELQQMNGLFDGNGKLKMSAKGFAPGVYICEVKAGDVVTRSRLIVY